MKNEILNENKYFNSGLYETVFYKKHDLDLYDDHNFELVEYNKNLITELWKEEGDLEGTEEEINDMIEEIFADKLSLWDTYFEPMIFNERIALECGLTPFTYDGINLLALSGCGMNLSPKLDAYQVLTHGTIDGNSEYFSVNNQNYCETVVGKHIVDQMDAILKGGN